MYDLPSENHEEPGLPDEFHDHQPELLSVSLSLIDYSADNFFTGKDLNLYYDVRHPNWYKRPDWFLSVGVPRLYENNDMRLSYVVWQEGINPFVNGNGYAGMTRQDGYRHLPNELTQLSRN